MNAQALRSIALLLFLAPALQGCGSSSKADKPPVVTVDPNTKGLNVLGSGTDVFGAYAVESNVKGRVLDVTAMNAAGLLVYSPDVQESKYEEVTGSTVSEYATSLATSLGLTGSYMFFSAEIQAAYSQDTYRKTGYSYASIIERHWKHSLKVEPGLWTSAAKLRPYLTTLARQAINDTDGTRKWTGAEVIAAYGTHVINGIYVGGRLDYHLTVQILEEQYQQSFSAYAKASFATSFASAGMTSTIDTTARQALDSYNKVTTINAKGGATQYAHPENDDDYKLWKASLDTSPVFCGIIGGGLMGVWELAETPARQAEIRAAFEAYAVGQESAFIPFVEKITDIKVIDAGQSTSVALDPGYSLIKSLAGDTVGGSVNGGIWRDTQRANYVYLAYKSAVTEQPMGVSEVHVSSSDAAVRDLFFGGAGGAGHDALYGASQPGCLANAAVNLNSGTCSSAGLSEWSSGWCAYYFWNASCAGNGTPLALHVVPQTAQTEAIRCLVVGDAVAADSNQAMATRIQHIYWGPQDANQDGKVDAKDASWVLSHVQWVRHVPDGDLVNLNHGTQSYRRYDWYDCGLGEGYDDAWWHAVNAVEDAQYIGYCLP